MPAERVVIITGAGQGIGRACARRLVEQGHAVVIAERDDEAGVQTQAELQGLGRARWVRTDVSREPDVARLVQQTMEQFGRIDALVNNAALLANKPVADLSLEEWNAVIGTNLTGAFLCARYCAPHLRRSGGAIVNLGSTRALMSEPGTEAYSASKGGIVALTHALAMSLAPVRVNCISPGWIDVSAWNKPSRRAPAALRPEDHAQHPVGRVGRPEDIAGLLSYLLSDDAGFITGQNFVVDGGMTKKMIYVE